MLQKVKSFYFKMQINDRKNKNWCFKSFQLLIEQKKDA